MFEAVPLEVPQNMLYFGNSTKAKLFFPKMFGYSEALILVLSRGTITSPNWKLLYIFRVRLLSYSVLLAPASVAILVYGDLFYHYFKRKLR